MDFPSVEPTAETLTPPPPVREPFWGYQDLLLMVGFTAGALFVVSIITAGLIGLHPSAKKDIALWGLPVQLIFYGLVYLGFRFTFNVRYGRPVLVSLGWRRTSFNPFIAAVGGVVLAFVVASIAGLLHTPQVSTPIDLFAGSTFTIALFVIFAAVIAPFTEEVFFRGFLQPLFSRTFGTAIGILITAVLFGALHAPEYSWAWQYALAVALAGAAFGWVRARTNSIIPSTIMHGCYNSVFLIAFIISKHAKHQ